MCYIFVEEDGAKIGLEGNRYYIINKNGSRVEVPAETVDAITILGNSHLTTYCIESCLNKNIPVSFMSKGGKYFGGVSKVINPLIQ